MPQQSQQPDNQPAQNFRAERAHSSGVAFSVVTHAIRMAVSLAPLAILEVIPNDHARANRFIKGAAIIGTGVNEMLWAAKVAKSREQERHR